MMIMNQFSADILDFLKMTWIINYISVFYLEKSYFFILFCLSMYIAYISVVILWSYSKNSFPFNLFK